MLVELDPPQGGLFDFFVQPFTPGLRAGLDLAAATPTQELADEIALLPRRTRDRPRLRELADGTSTGRNLFANDTLRYFDSSLTALWPQMQAAAAAERALPAETLLSGGVDAMLATLVPG